MPPLDELPPFGKGGSADALPEGPLRPQAPFWVKLTIVFYALIYISLALYFVVDSWVGDKVHLKRLLGITSSGDLPVLFVSAVYAVLGAILGAGALDIVSFHKYVAVKQDFQKPHVWGYFVGPWLAAVLGLMVFALLQTGLLVFAGNRSTENSSDVANLGYLAIGFLSGFGWLEATERVREIVSRFFASAKQRSPSREEKSVPGSAATDAVPLSNTTPDGSNSEANVRQQPNE